MFPKKKKSCPQQRPEYNLTFKSRRYWSRRYWSRQRRQIRHGVSVMDQISAMNNKLTQQVWIGALPDWSAPLAPYLLLHCLLRKISKKTHPRKIPPWLRGVFLWRNICTYYIYIYIYMYLHIYTNTHMYKYICIHTYVSCRFIFFWQ